MLEYFAYVRAQTEIDLNTGVAKHGSLRFSRVLKKGLVFEFQFQLGSPVENDPRIADLTKICQVTRKFGSINTRGFGEITVDLIQGEDKPYLANEYPLEDFDQLADEATYSVQLKLNNLEQLVVPNQIGDNDISAPCIGGSYIRGALASYVIKTAVNAKEPPHENHDFRELFLSANLKFSNFYPVQDNGRFYPSPISMVKEKGKEVIYDMAFQEDYAAIKKSETSIQKLPGYAHIGEDSVKTYSPPMKFEYHHRRPKNRRIGHVQKKGASPYDEYGNLFFFQVIDEGECFGGDLIGKGAYIKKLLSLVPMPLGISVGKSRTAQYGHCLLQISGVKELNDPVPHSEDSRFVITLSSDMILTNEFGFATPDCGVLHQEIAKTLNVGIDEIPLVDSFLKFTKIGGFMASWNYPKIQTQALAAGSVLVFDKPESGINLQPLNGKSFGSRQSEGFGLILVNYHGFGKKLWEKDEENAPDEGENSDPGEVPKSVATDQLVFYILWKQLIEKLKGSALEEAKKTIGKYGHKSIPSSFLQRIKLYINSSLNFAELVKKLLELKKIAATNFDKISDPLLMKIIEEHVVITQVTSTVKELQLTIPDAYPDTQKAELSKDQLFTLYQAYGERFLTNLQYLIRRDKK